jgi:hypothetical protein
MGRSQSQSNQHGGVALVASYIEHIGGREPDNRRALDLVASTEPHNASLLIGRGCLLLRDGLDRAANTVFNRAAAITRPYINDAELRFGTLGGSAVQLHHLAVMLRGRDDPGSPAAFQEATHDEALRDLDQTKRMLNGKTHSQYVHRGLVGWRTEQELLGLTTRSSGPGTLAVSSLLHHDDSRTKASNIDLVVVDRPSETAEPVVGRAQLKNFCLGYCGSPYRAIVREKVRGEYESDTVLISGHCDVRGPGPQLAPVARYLGQEAKGRASPGVIDDLNERSLNILGLIIDPPEERLGIQPVLPLKPYEPRAPGGWDGVGRF